jgi:ribosomal protein S18 acetylase RimI-like enzyme
MHVAIRKAERADLDALGRLGAMLIRTHYDFDRQRFLPPFDGVEKGYASFLGRAIESPDDCVFVAERDAEIVGYVFAALEPLAWKELRGPAGFIHDVAVTEEARRSGIATQLIEAAIEWLRAHGAPRVIVWSAASNDIARALFRGMGFRETMIEMTMELDGGRTS